MLHTVLLCVSFCLCVFMPLGLRDMISHSSDSGVI